MTPLTYDLAPGVRIAFGMAREPFAHQVPAIQGTATGAFGGYETEELWRRLEQEQEAALDSNWAWDTGEAQLREMNR